MIKIPFVFRRKVLCWIPVNWFKLRAPGKQSGIFGSAAGASPQKSSDSRGSFVHGKPGKDFTTRPYCLHHFHPPCHLRRYIHYNFIKKCLFFWRCTFCKNIWGLSPIWEVITLCYCGIKVCFVLLGCSQKNWPSTQEFTNDSKTYSLVPSN